MKHCPKKPHRILTANSQLHHLNHATRFFDLGVSVMIGRLLHYSASQAIPSPRKRQGHAVGYGLFRVDVPSTHDDAANFPPLSFVS